MEFKIGHQQVKLKRRESIVAAIFVVIIIFVGAAGIIGPKPGVVRIITSIVYVVFFGLILRSIKTDYNKTKLKMLNHRLIIGSNTLILEQEGVRNEIELKKIYSIRFQYKRKVLNTIVIDIKKNCGFKLKGYDDMHMIMTLLKKSVPPSKIK